MIAQAEPSPESRRGGGDLCHRFFTVARPCAPALVENHSLWLGRAKMRILLALTFLLIGLSPFSAQGNLSRNRYDPNSTANPYGAGSPYDPNSINNPYGRYGSQYSPDSANTPYATNAPKLYDQEGNYRGRLSTNPYDPDSTSNTYGLYGSEYSPDSINNPYGA